MSQMSVSCRDCRLPKANGFCHICNCNLCRKCSQYVEAAEFELDPEAPQDWFEKSFCHHCYEMQVLPRKEAYERIAELARDVHYWPKTYRGTVPVIRKSTGTVAVSGSKDLAEVLLKLAFLGARLGFNALINGEIKGAKVRSGGEGYQKTQWSGVALPVNVDLAQVERQEYREDHWQLTPL